MNYFFHVGTKIPYSEWPELVHTFLQKQGLSGKRFMYYFETLLGTDPNEDRYKRNLAQGGCSRILKDCPELGPMQFRLDAKNGRFDLAYLSNIGEEPFPEEKILPLMKKIHRSYALTESNLYYYDIDFFHDRIPYEQDMKLRLEDRPYGSGICLHRDACADNYIQLSIDLLHDGKVLDAKPYFDAMRELLPGIRVSTLLEPHLSQSEKAAVEATNCTAAPFLKQCREFFSQWFTDNNRQNSSSSKYSIAPTLKKLCRQYGYSYKSEGVKYIFSIHKRSQKGNVLLLDVWTGPSRYSLDFDVSFQGLGFNHRLGYCMHTPTDQATADDCLKQVVSTLVVFEKTMLPLLDALFPETPDWFLPFL